MMQFGEAFDKVARVVGLGYTGGPKVDKLAKEGQANINLPKTHFEGDTLDFSFSGIKTAVINLHHKNPNINKADLAASFEETVSEILITNTKKAIEATGINTIVCYQISNGKIIANGYMYIKGYEGVNCYFTDEEGNTLSSTDYELVKDYIFR